MVTTTALYARRRLHLYADGVTLVAVAVGGGGVRIQGGAEGRVVRCFWAQAWPRHWLTRMAVSEFVARD